MKRWLFALLGVAVLCCGMLTAPLAAMLALDEASAAACAPTLQAGAIDVEGRLNANQLANAQVIVSVGQRRGIPPRGWIIAVATALQESGLEIVSV